jgi:predicted regulator of Ras-like GTPase activity (Roadblock/LC7/MglB family)
MTREQIADAVASMAKVRGVRASILASAMDGVPIESVLQVGDDDRTVAALGSFLYRKARASAQAAGLGHIGFLHLQAEHGRICVLGGDDLVLVLVADLTANIGVMRVEMLRAAGRLAA